VSGAAGDTALVDGARAWALSIYSHPRHLEAALEWLLRLDPEASEAARIAAVTHDVERAFPPDEQPYEPGRAWDDEGYQRWHSDRSAQIVGDWLAQQGAAADLVREVRELVRVHEWGGWPEADLVQAADSLSFLETMTPLFAEMARTGRTTPASAERKLRWMYDRMRAPGASELGAPMLEEALAELEAAIRAPQYPH
jgi:hypothetical protein